MACTECGEEGHPWWDHGPVSSFGEEPMEPYVDWNITPATEGVEFTTRGQRRKFMDQHDFEYNKKKERPYGEALYFDQKGK